jgi:anthranilate/para-aminobenzoate synthase component II
LITFVSDSVLVSTIPFQLLLQDLKHLFVFNLIEALVELPDRREIWRRAQTEQTISSTSLASLVMVSSGPTGIAAISFCGCSVRIAQNAA